MNDRNGIYAIASNTGDITKAAVQKMDYESEINRLKDRMTNLENSISEARAELKNLLEQIRFETDRRDLEGLRLQ